jgi:hypothetical protein
VIIATAARLNLVAAWIRMGAEHLSTPSLPKEGRIDRHESIALQQTGHEAPRVVDQTDTSLGPSEVSATTAFVRAQTVPRAPPSWGPGRRLNKLHPVLLPAQTVLLRVLGRHLGPGGSQAESVASCARLSFQPGSPRLCETTYTHFSPQQALKRGTAVDQQIMHIFSRYEG